VWEALGSKNSTDLLKSLGVEAAVCGELWRDEKNREKLTLLLLEQRGDQAFVRFFTVVDVHRAHWWWGDLPRVGFPLDQAGRSSKWAAEVVAAMERLSRVKVGLRATELERTPRDARGRERVTAHVLLDNSGEVPVRVFAEAQVRVLDAGQDYGDACRGDEFLTLGYAHSLERSVLAHVQGTFRSRAVAPGKTVDLGKVTWAEGAGAHAVLVSVAVLEPARFVVSASLEPRTSENVLELTEPSRSEAPSPPANGQASP
jgi:hypothetical protein